jgi:signal transduction histidine kinase/ActR/RegA family two-component response regulator
VRTITRTVEEGRDHFIEYRFLHPDGGQRWVEGRGKLFRDQGGRPVRLIGVCLDVTDRKRSEEALREADRRKDEFLATLAHELRNPLAPIRTGLQILMCGEVADPLVEMMDRQAEHLASLIDDLMDASRISLGKMDLRKEVVTLASVVGQAVAMARPLIDERGHELSVTVPDGDERLEADPTRLVQILSNLLENAAKYTDPEGQIRVHARREGGEVVIGIKDTGIGIAPESLTKVFDLFMQIERRLDRSQGGLGIGLCLVRSLVEMHGGTVTAHSEGPGRGSEFVVRLPAIAGDRVEPQGTPQPPKKGDGRESPGRRILVVDDNQDAANSLARYLKRLAGHEVEVAYDGPGALGLARTFRPDVVLLDIGLPGMSGYEVAERLREWPETVEARLIALTGWGQEDDRRRSRSAGIDVHLVKPVDLDAILELLAGPASGEGPGTIGSSEATPG